ncbi:hypothetical protein [Gehongia tenuis]|uniref:Uncharacterized protein n=1 Tax=Gehongia tenuis TaxID=2763655 RepID=A0A926D336_9FIRM|nr:hypothetical protein [Gehongia tenuis]MBC8530457.1 hypothetical protein [Gehongia tenuis]
MWTKRSPFLSARVRLAGMKPKLRLYIPLALFALHDLILGFDGLMALIPGAAGRMGRGALDAADGFLMGMMAEPPQSFVHVDVEDGSRRIQVDLKTMGWGA